MYLVKNFTDMDLTEPIRPPKPRYFEISNVTSSSMYLEWSPPFRSGGGTLEGYILSHFEPVDCETQTAGQEEKKVSKIFIICIED